MKQALKPQTITKKNKQPLKSIFQRNGVRGGESEGESEGEGERNNDNDHQNGHPTKPSNSKKEKKKQRREMKKQRIRSLNGTFLNNINITPVQDIKKKNEGVKNEGLRVQREEPVDIKSRKDNNRINEKNPKKKPKVPDGEFFELLKKEKLIPGWNESEEQENEDKKLLRYYSKKLGIDKVNPKDKKKIKSELSKDGLDFLLDFKNNNEKGKEKSAKKKEKMSESENGGGEDEDDFLEDELMSGDGNESDEDEDEDDSEQENNEDDDDFGINLNLAENSDLENDFEDFEHENSKSENNDSEEDRLSKKGKQKVSSEDSSTEKNAQRGKKRTRENLEQEEGEEKELKEDIYGRFINVKTGKIVTDNKGVSHGGLNVGIGKSEQVTGKYVPPHLRTSQSSSSNNKGGEPEFDPRLLKRVMGLINRISTSNISVIVKEVHGLFSDHTYSRNALTSTLNHSILLNCCDTPNAINHLVMVQVGLITALHSMIGIEIGGMFLETLTKRFQKYSQDLGGENENKAISYEENFSKLAHNAILIYTHLYHFGVIHCTLLYDLVRMMIRRFTELDIELLLSLLIHAGSQMRRDDPNSLKNVVELVQEKNDIIQNASTSYTRAKFLVNTILSLKDNKNILHAEAKSQQETIKKIRKAIGDGLNDKKKGTSNASDFGNGAQLRISWKDLTSIETKGRWWLVGSSWMGGLVDDDKNDENEGSKRNIRDEVTISKVLSAKFSVDVSPEMVKLALSHRMNTDVKRVIFCSIMSAQDYLEAYEKLVRLNLKNRQDREISFVILHCCSQEPQFNPFYAHLSIKLTEFQDCFKFNFQTAFWDKFKILDENLPARTISNLSKLLAHLVIKGALNLTVFKNIDFLTISSKSANFFKSFFTVLLTDFKEEEIKAVFHRVVYPPKQVDILEQTTKDEFYQKLREGIVTFYLKHMSIDETNEILKKRLEITKKMLKSTKVSLF